ncbi:MAG: hypothetical protein WCI51_16895 [Lentisphaerota bacterium]
MRYFGGTICRAAGALERIRLQGVELKIMERKIDQMAYALYGLTAAEIAIVEGK